MAPSPVPVGGVWMVTRGDRVCVLLQIDGVWRVVIDEARDDESVSSQKMASVFTLCPADPVLHPE